MASQVAEEQITQLVASIKSQGPILDAEARRLRVPAVLDGFDKWSHDSWCLSVVGDCLVRLGMFTEQNFNFVETMGTISVARYIFELSVWLHLFSLDSRYGLVYYARLIDTQRRFWTDHRKQLDREITLLKLFEKREKDAQSDALSRIRTISDSEEKNQAWLAIPRGISERIDEEASRRFSIYAEQAKVNGYGFQAHLIEQKVIPQIEKALADIHEEDTALEARLSQEIEAMIPHRWNWRRMAQKVGLTDEYDFIYTFASKLLHATPASITTDHKNLEPAELVLFLKIHQRQDCRCPRTRTRIPLEADKVLSTKSAMSPSECCHGSSTSPLTISAFDPVPDRPFQRSLAGQ